MKESVLKIIAREILQKALAGNFCTRIRGEAGGSLTEKAVMANPKGRSCTEGHLPLQVSKREL